MFIKNLKLSSVLFLIFTLFFIETIVYAQSNCVTETDPNDVCIGVIVDNRKCATGAMSGSSDVDAYTKVLESGEWLVRFISGDGRLSMSFADQLPNAPIEKRGQSQIIFTLGSSRATCISIDQASTNYTIEFKRVGGGSGDGGDGDGDNGGGNGDGDNGGGSKKDKRKVKKHNRRLCKRIKNKVSKKSKCRGRKASSSACTVDTTQSFVEGSATTLNGDFDVLLPKVTFDKKGYSSTITGRLFSEEPSKAATFSCKSSIPANKRRKFKCKGSIVPSAGGKKSKLCCNGTYTKSGTAIGLSLKCGGPQKFTFNGTVPELDDAYRDADGDGDVDMKDFSLFSSCLNGSNKKNFTCPEVSVNEANNLLIGNVDDPDSGVFLPNDVTHR